ncbi:MAG: ribosomal RNA small subunit methyltransferase A [Acidobacteria bacterium]|jgi:16S rRNA (adenine1518-N6/adenine1519-N6)-dimethyltransferase|nr:MAG: ribosomal RNA small subunit methyltransferase A [Acidobacteriota bacterium]
MSDEKRVNVPKVASTRRPKQKPKLGQHFLVSDSAAMRMADALGDVSESTVLEIGPGRGVISSLLAKRARRLIAVEIDRVLAAQLRLKFGMTHNVEVIEADILSIDFDSLFGPKPGLGRPGIELKPIPVRVVGNLPYFITSDILLRLFAFAKYFDTIVIMVQREVADRLAAPPGGSDYGLLSATAQLYAKVEKLFTLPPEAFEPAPKVHSTVLRLNIAPQIEKLGVAGDGFIGFLKLSFAQKRKTLWNNLKSRYDEAELRRAMTQARINPSARAETLSLKQSATLFRALRSSAEGS